MTRPTTHRKVAGAAALVELEEFDEQPATARTDRARAPETPASKRTRVRRRGLFMTLSVRTRRTSGMSGS